MSQEEKGTPGGGAAGGARLAAEIGASTPKRERRIADPQALSEWIDRNAERLASAAAESAADLAQPPAADSLAAHMRRFGQALLGIYAAGYTLQDVTGALASATALYPADAKRMNLDEYLAVHPDAFEKALGNVIGAKGAAASTAPADEAAGRVGAPKVKAQPSAAQAVSEISALMSRLPQNHVKPISKLANEITKDFLDAGTISLRVSRPGSKKAIATKAMLAYEGERISITGRAKFTAYDRAVHDAVVTLYEAGNEIMTPEMVYRAMSGMDGTEKVSPQAASAVTRSLDKSRATTLRIDCSAEAQMYGRGKATYEGYLLASDKITVEAGGYTKEAYKLLRKPLLYDYSQQVSGQIVTVPIALLQTKDGTRSTAESIVIRDYLLRQIEWMRSTTAKKRSNKIAYDGLFEELEVTRDKYTPEAYKDKTRKMRNHAVDILNVWMKQGYIKGHEHYKEKNAIKGIVVTLP